MAFATTTLVVVVWAVAAVTTVAVFVAAFRLAIRPLYLRAHYTAQGVRGLPFRPLVGNISELRAGRNLPYGTLGESFRARYGPVYVSGLPARQHHTTPPRSVRPPPSVTRCAARPRRPKRACGVGAWRCASASCLALLLWPLSRCVVLFTACRPGVARAPYRSRLTLVTSHRFTQVLPVSGAHIQTSSASYVLAHRVLRFTPRGWPRCSHCACDVRRQIADPAMVKSVLHTHSDCWKKVHRGACFTRASHGPLTRDLGCV